MSLLASEFSQFSGQPVKALSQARRQYQGRTVAATFHVPPDQQVNQPVIQSPHPKSSRVCRYHALSPQQRKMKALILKVLVALVVPLAAQCMTSTGLATKELDVALEHAFGSGAFTRTGSIRGEFQLQIAHKAAVELKRNSWSAAEASAFAGILDTDDFYRVRVRAGSAPGWVHAVASVRARCLQAAGFKEVMSLMAGRDGSITGLQYSTPLRSCQPGMAVAVMAKSAGGPAEHGPLRIGVDVPREAPPVVMVPLDPATSAATGQPMPPWLMGEQQEESLKKYLAQLQQAGGQQQTAEHRGKEATASGQVDKEGKAGLEEEEVAPSPPEKSFIQQNWWFLIPVGIVVFNSLGRLMPDPT